MAGETQNYHESRNPDHADRGLRLDHAFDHGQVDHVGYDRAPRKSAAVRAGLLADRKEVALSHVRQGDLGSDAGNLTIEIRHQTGTAVTDAGGTILATSGAVAIAASKTNASWFLDFTVESRAQIGTAAGLFAKGFFLTDAATGYIAASSMPMFIPQTAAAATNVDTTLAGYINIQWKRSGSSRRDRDCPGSPGQLDHLMRGLLLLALSSLERASGAAPAPVSRLAHRPQRHARLPCMRNKYRFACSLLFDGCALEHGDQGCIDVGLRSTSTSSSPASPTTCAPPTSA